MCVLSDVIEHVRDPLVFLRELRRVLARDAVLFVTTPSLDSWSARLLKQNWMEFKPEHLYYFDSSTIQDVLLQSGYSSIVVRPNRKVLTLDYIARHFLSGFRYRCSRRCCARSNRAVPEKLATRPFPIVASGVAVFARLGELRECKLLSIVVPAFNEASTMGALLDRVLAKTDSGVDIEVIVVESHSTDGTREKVRAISGDPRAGPIYSRIGPVARAMPSGRARRCGGDYRPDPGCRSGVASRITRWAPRAAAGGPGRVRAGRSRHGGAGRTWKMRQFDRSVSSISQVMNLGHLVFTILFNPYFPSQAE